MKAYEIASAVYGRLSGDPEAIVTDIITDSRLAAPGSLFVPVIGARVDAHRFIGDVFRNGSAVSFSSEGNPGFLPEEKGKALIEVDDTVAALQRLGSYYRETKVHCPVIGVTGSVGKTTVREMTKLALSSAFRTYSTKGNANSQVGVPISICGIPEDAEAAVLELGISEEGEMSRISAAARPNIAVVTNIGISHIAQLKSRENIMREKLRIADYLSGNALILCQDDELLSALTPGKLSSMGIRGGSEIRIVGYGFSGESHYRAVDFHTGPHGNSYELSIGGEIIGTVGIKAPGKHMISNSLAAIAAATEAGCDPSEAAKMLSSFTNLSGRGEIIRTGDITVINDSYNAVPSSMEAGLRVLESMDIAQGGRRIAVLADMLELGESEREYHEEIGRFIAGKLRSIDVVYFYGALMKHAYDVLISENTASELSHFTDYDELRSALFGALREGDTVFLKGSNAMGLSGIAGELSGKGTLH